MLADSHKDTNITIRRRLVRLTQRRLARFNVIGMTCCCCSSDAYVLTSICQRCCFCFVPEHVLFKYKQFIASLTVSQETGKDTNLLTLFAAIRCNSPFTSVHFLCARALLCRPVFSLKTERRGFCKVGLRHHDLLCFHSCICGKM